MAKQKSERHVRAGQKGGAARSAAKRASSSANLIKARVKRYEGRVLAAQATLDARTAQIIDEGEEIDKFLAVANGFTAAHNANPNRAEFTLPAESDEPYPLTPNEDEND